MTVFISVLSGNIFSIAFLIWMRGRILMWSTLLIRSPEGCRLPYFVDGLYQETSLLKRSLEDLVFIKYGGHTVGCSTHFQTIACLMAEVGHWTRRDSVILTLLLSGITCNLQ